MRYAGYALGLLALLVLPNLIWLGTSSVRIQNDSGLPIAGVAYMACGTTHALGTLGPGKSVFRLLESCGDDSLEIRIAESVFCRTYVEGDLYHIDAVVTVQGTMRCSDHSLFDSLFLKKVIF